jgi:hypothetical protein
MRNVSDKSCRENQNTHFVFGNLFLENYAVFEIMWKNIVQRGRSYDKVTHAHGMLDNKGYTHKICNT